MAKRGAVRVSITGDAQGLSRATRDAERHLGRLSGSSRRVDRDMDRAGKRGSASLKRLAGAAAGAAAAYVGIGQAKAAVSTTTDLAKTTISLNKNLGLSVERASQFAAVLKARGVDSRQVSQAFGTLARNAQAAAKGTGAQSDAFKRLGVTQKELKSLSPDELIGQVAEGMERLGPGTERTALSMKLFGRGWQSVVPLLRGGKEEMDAQLKLATKYGATFGGKTIKSMKDWIQAQRESKLAMMGLQVTFATTVVPVLTKGIRAVAGFVASLRSGNGAVGQFGQIVRTAFGVVTQVWRGFLTVTRQNIAALNLSKRDVAAFGQALVNTFRFILTVAKPIWAGLRVFITGALRVIGGVIKVFTGIMTGDFRKAWQGVKQIFSGALKVIAGIVRTFTAPLRQALAAIGNALVSYWRGVWNRIKQIASSALRGALGAIRATVGGFKSAASAIGNGLVRGFNVIKSIPGKVKSIFGDVLGFIRKLPGKAGAAMKSFGTAVKNGIIRGFTGAANKVVDFANQIIGVINKLPFVNIGKIGHIGGGRGPQRSHGPGGQALAKGGIVKKPTIIVGEEAPQHPEYVLATNPAYKKRNVGLWAEAGHQLGVPGFAKGGRLADAAKRAGIQPYLAGGRIDVDLNKLPGVRLGREALSRGAEFSAKKLIGLLPDWKLPAPLTKTGDWLKSLSARYLKKHAKPPALEAMMRQATKMDRMHTPYVYGGGHNASFSGPWDCSGAVSAVLHAGNLLGSPGTTDLFKNWGQEGDGRHVTVGVRGSSGRSAHMMMKLGSKYFESGSGHGAAFTSGWSGHFPIHRHPPGLAQGGIIGLKRKKFPHGFDQDPRSPNFVGYGLARGGRRGRRRGRGMPGLLWNRVRGLPKRMRNVIYEAAIRAGIVESGFRNLAGGDRDSMGYFQIRGMHGSASQRRNPRWQADWFVRTAKSMYRRGIGASALAALVERPAAQYRGRYATVDRRRLGSLLAMGKPTGGSRRRPRRRGERAGRGATESYENQLAEADLGIAAADATAGIGDDIGAIGAKRALMKGHRTKVRARLRKINRALKGRLRPSTRKRLLEEKSTLLGDLTSSIGDDKSLAEQITTLRTGGAVGAGDATTAAAEPNAALEESNRLRAEQIVIQKQLLHLSTVQAPAVIGAVIAAVNGGIGGRTGLAMQTPTVAGSVARY